MKSNRISILTIILLGATTAFAQNNNLNQEVKVIKAYEPVINDAYKISSLPKIVDTLNVTPTFDYDDGVTPEMYKTKYKPKQMKPAKLVAEPLPKLYNVYVKGGFGMYTTPLLNIYTGSQRSEKWLWNANMNYTSSSAKVKNEDDKRVYAGLSKFDINGSVHRFFKNDMAASISAGYGNRGNYYYGYATELNLPDSIIPLKRKDIEKQSVNYYNIGATVYSTNLDSAEIDYKVSLGYNGLKTKDSKSENNIHFDGYISYLLDKEFLGVKCVIDNYKTQGLANDVNSAVVNFNPWVGAYGRKWRVKAGVNTFYDQRNQKYMFFPDISMQYNIIDYFLLPYLELNGNYKVHDYKDMYFENQFVKSDLRINPTKTRINLAVGFRGNISSRIAFNVKAEYAKIDNQYFFVNDTSTMLHEKFFVVYDDIMRTHILGEISYKTSEKFKIGLKGHYYIYDMSTELEAWHLPTYNISLDASYNLSNKIIATANVYAVSRRQACLYQVDGPGKVLPVAKELDGVVDINLGVEYRITKRFSGFLDLNNITGSRYYQWNQYANQRFNFMLGLTYAF
ncbi:MAG: hypothetical protein IKW86_04360 [Salinivirgaceae bacterium]|nr:hypothetical protein [Salinivirgaceae bacterium]